MPFADYVPTKFGELAKLFPEANLAVRDVKGMVECAMAGFEPGLENPFQSQAYERVKADVRLHKSLDNKKPKKTDILDADKKELAILKGASSLVNAGQALGNVLRNCDLGEHMTQCIPKEGMTEEQLGETFLAVSGAGDWSKWAKGDLINEFEKRGIPNALSTICSQLNIENEYQTLSRYARTSASTPLDQRALPNLRFSHYAEISCTRFDKDPVKQKEHISEVLQEASEKALNVAQVREACLARKGQETAPTPPPAKKYRWLVIEDCASGKMYLTDKEPEGGDGTWAIDMEEGVFAEAHGETLHAWMPIARMDAEVATNLEPEMEEV